MHGETIVGTGGDLVELRSSENPDAWITAEYRDGWVKRKLLSDDADEYADMVHPYYYRCRCCREYHSTERWGADSRFCPWCEQRWQVIGDWFEQTEDGELPQPTACPDCESIDVDREIFGESTCNECGAAFDMVQDGETA